MNVRPNVKKLDRSGLQGRVNFDPTNPNADIALYKEVKKLIEGDLGLGGSGGTLANKVQTGRSFQASHVFNSATERDSVAERLEKQFTEQMQNMIGGRAQKAGLSMGEFLSSKGIHGPMQLSKEKGSVISPYHYDNFKKVTQNPITGSTERLMKAAMKGFGSVHEVSGGTNEKRTISAYLRPEEATQVNKMSKTAADRIAAGTYNMGQMEAFYASTKQRETFKAKQRTSKNDLVTDMIADDNNVVTQEVKSKLLKQSKQKEKFAAVSSEMRASGELPDAELKDKGGGKDKGGEKERSGSSGSIFKSAMNTILQIGGYVRSMLGYLSKIAIELGKTISEGQSAGLDANTADRFVRYAKLNKVHHYDNAFMHLNAANAIQAGFGDKGLASKHGYEVGEHTGSFSGMTDVLIKHSDHMNTGRTMDDLYAIAAKYVIANKGSAKSMATAKLALTRYTGNASVAESFGALYNTELGKGSFTEKGTAKDLNYVSHLVSNATKEGNLQMTSSGVRSPFYGDQMMGGQVLDAKSSAKDLNDVFNKIEQVFDGFRKKLLNRTDLIIIAFDKLIRGVVALAVFLKIPGAEKFEKSLKKAGMEPTKAEFVSQISNAYKLQKVGDDIISGLIGEKDAAGNIITPERRKKYVDDARKAIQSGDQIAVKKILPFIGEAKYKEKYVSAIEAYSMSKSAFKDANDNIDNLKSGSSSFTGDLTTIGRDSQDLVAENLSKLDVSVEYGAGKRTLLPILDKAKKEKLPAGITEAKIKADVASAADERVRFKQYLEKTAQEQQRRGVMTPERAKAFILRSLRDYDATGETPRNWSDSTQDFGESHSSLFNGIKKPSSGKTPEPDSFAGELASLGMKTSSAAKAIDGASGSKGAKQEVSVGTNVHITLGGKTILDQTDLSLSSRIRDYNVNV